MQRLTFKAFQEFHCVIISYHVRWNVRQGVSIIPSYSVYSIYGRQEWGQRITVCKANGSSLGTSPWHPPGLWERVVHTFWGVVRWIGVQQHASGSTVFCIMNLNVKQRNTAITFLKFFTLISLDNIVATL